MIDGDFGKPGPEAAAFQASASAADFGIEDPRKVRRGSRVGWDSDTARLTRRILQFGDPNRGEEHRNPYQHGSGTLSGENKATQQHLIFDTTTAIANFDAQIHTQTGK